MPGKRRLIRYLGISFTRFLIFFNFGLGVIEWIKQQHYF